MIFFSKSVRGWLAEKNRAQIVMAAPMTRGHSNESAFKHGRAVYILGATMAPLVPAFARKYHLPFSHVNTKAYHVMIKSFPTELGAMRAAARLYPNRIDFMVDTYDLKQGVRNAITVAKELRAKGQSVVGVTIDSGKTIGDYIRTIRWTRRMLDRAGFPKMSIAVAGNFDEYKIAELVKTNAPVNRAFIGTEAVTSSDAPKLETVLKLAEMRCGKTVSYQAKLAPGKESYPGRKQVWRTYRRGQMVRDVIALDHERARGRPLLRRMVNNGKVTYRLPSLQEIQRYVQKELATLPERLKDIHRQHPYSVKISPELQRRFNVIKKEHS